MCAICRHRYRDSNPGFRTENPPWEVNLGRFRPDKGNLVQSSAVEFGGVGDIIGDTEFPSLVKGAPWPGAARSSAVSSRAKEK
jgi:hypothetical protein